MSSNPLLGVNIDHVASIRQNRGTPYPDPVYAAAEAERGGADGITIHLREDRRHIQERDVSILRQTLLSKMNLEMAVTEDMLAIACKTQPEDCCLVPERREELTTEGGLDVKSQASKIKDACQQLSEAGIFVSLFIDPDFAQIDAAKNSGAPCIEIHTGTYADTRGPDQKKELEKIIKASHYAHELGLQVNAGHGLSYQNTLAVAQIGIIQEFNIGHAIVAQAIFSGIRQAVVEMKEILRRARQ